MATLQNLLLNIEEKVGDFSGYKVKMATNQQAGQTLPNASAISFNSKPAWQLLKWLGVVTGAEDELSARVHHKALETEAKDIYRIHRFDKQQGCLTISGKRIDRLVKSAKVYVNTDIFPAGLYTQIVGRLISQDPGQDTQGEYWQNLAVAVCHSQEMDLLVKQETIDGKAITVPEVGEINDEKVPILLLSSPALNVAYGYGKELDANRQSYYIQAMYRNLFNAAKAQGRDYIAMPAAGLGVFGGDAKMYFDRTYALTNLW